MDPLLIVLLVLAPLLPVLLFPARVMGRGGNFVFVGAGLIIAMMMALFIGMQMLSGAADDPELQRQSEELSLKRLVIPEIE